MRGAAGPSVTGRVRRDIDLRQLFEQRAARGDRWAGDRYVGLPVEVRVEALGECPTRVFTAVGGRWSAALPASSGGGMPEGQDPSPAARWQYGDPGRHRRTDSRISARLRSAESLIAPSVSNYLMWITPALPARNSLRCVLTHA